MTESGPPACDDRAMDLVAAVVMVFAGVFALAASWNAARPVVDPTRFYSPSWLPAMIVTELAPFWVLVTLAVAGVGAAFGAASLLVGQVGLAMLAVAALLLVRVIGRTRAGVRQVRRSVSGPVHPAIGRARLIGRPVPTPDGVDELLGVPWRGGLTADLTFPSARPATADVMVYVHGGGWTNGDPQRQARDLYHALALDGWVVAAVRYPFTPEVSVEEQIEAIRAAVRWARSGLAEHGFVADRVVLTGGSAGGHLAAMAALTPGTDEDRVAACVGVYGIYDMANRNRTRAPWAKIRNDVMLATVAEAPQRYAAVSPIDQVAPDSPPFLLVHGTHDTLVTFAEAQQFDQVLAAAGRPADLLAVPGAQHAFDAVSSITSRTVAAAIRDWLRRTVP